MAEKQKKGHFAPIRFLILTAACAMFLYSGYQLFVHWYEDRQSQKGQQDLIDQAVVVIKSTEGESEPAEKTEQSDVSEATEPEKVLADAPPIFVDFETLLSENPNIVAWIYSEGTVINYPVVQGEDNMYYVDRLPDGQYNPHGSIFLDYRNLSDFGDFIRTAANTGAEDVPNLDNIHVNMEIFQAYAKGYLSTATFLTPLEISLLPYGCTRMSFMQAVRFYVDYLNGDTYYQIAYPEHNLVRTKAQIRLFEEQENAKPQMQQIIDSFMQ